MAKIERKYLAHYIAVDVLDTIVKYERLGKDLEEFTPELAAQVDTKKNILGETSVLISGYEKTAGVEPFYADQDSMLYTRLQRIIDDGLLLDDLKTEVVEVKLWKDAGNGMYSAIREEAYIEITSYGGDTTGYRIAFTLHFTGKKVKGSFDLANKTFIEE